GPGAAVESRPADPLAGEKHPGVVRGAVGVLERDTVKGHRVIAILEAAEKRLAVAETSAVGADAERPGGHQNHFGVVSDRGSEIFHELLRDFGFCGSRFEWSLYRRRLRRQ